MKGETHELFDRRCFARAGNDDERAAFYEKEGIIDTQKVESGRRYYDDADVLRLISAKKYRAMGVPLRDIAQQFGKNGMSGSAVIERMREKRDESHEQMMKYAGLVQDIEHLIGMSEEGIASCGRVDIRKMQNMLIFIGKNGNIVPQDKEGQQIAQRFLEAVPAVSYGIHWEKEQERPTFALCISEERGKAFGLSPDGKNIRLLEGGMALHAVTICGEEQYEKPESIFRPILNFAREHRFAQKGALLASILFVDCSGGDRKHYYDTYMVFE